MLSKKMQDAINKQINAELYSSYLYLAMSAYFESQSLKGFAKWMAIQFKEEQGHALKFFKYINDRGGKVQLQAIDAPPKDFKSSFAVFEETLKHEQKVTSLIHALLETAQAEKDYATQQFLQWFIGEQVEEEAAAQEIVDKMKMIGESTGGLFALDHQLGKRE